MPLILNEYDIRKIALFAVFVLAVIGIIYLFTAQPFTIPLLLPIGESIPVDCIDGNRQKECLLEASS